MADKVNHSGYEIRAPLKGVLRGDQTQFRVAERARDALGMLPGENKISKIKQKISKYTGFILGNIW